MRIILMIVIVNGFVLINSVKALMLQSHNVIMLVNSAREANKLNTLKESYILDKAAEDKLNDMIKNNYFAHTSPQGVTPWHWFKINNYDYEYAGENLAIGFYDAVDQHNAWMNSSKHRKNILNPHYNEIGVAIKKGIINNQKVIITVQLFGKSNQKKNLVLNHNEKEFSQQNKINLLGKNIKEVAGINIIKNKSISLNNFQGLKQKIFPNKINQEKIKDVFVYLQNNQEQQKKNVAYILLVYLNLYIGLFLVVIVREIDVWLMSSLKIKN